jgi:hypothetical protein
LAAYSRSPAGLCLPHEIEVQPVDSPVAGGVMGHLARDAVELTGTAEHHEVVGAAVEVTPDPDIAEPADLTIQVDGRVALCLVPLEPARDAIATDSVVAVVWVEKLFLEAERVVAHSMGRLLLREHREVMIDRKRRDATTAAPIAARAAARISLRIGMPPA